VPFGFREVAFRGIHFYLNGIRCNLRGESPAYSEKQAMMSTREAALRMVQRYNPSCGGFLRDTGTRPGFEEAYDILVKSFAAVAVFDKDYDGLGVPPEAGLRLGLDRSVAQNTSGDNTNPTRAFEVAHRDGVRITPIKAPPCPRQPLDSPAFRA